VGGNNKKHIITNDQLKEIKKSVKAYIINYGLEYAIEQIQIDYKNNEELKNIMLFLIEDIFNIKIKDVPKLTKEDLQIIEKLDNSFYIENNFDCLFFPYL